MVGITIFLHQRLGLSPTLICKAIVVDQLYSMPFVAIGEPSLSIRAPFYREGFMKPMGILERHTEALISKDIESGSSTSGKN